MRTGWPDFGPESANFGSERADFRPRRDNFGPERADLRPERADLGPERADLGPERGPSSLGGWGRTDGRLEIHPCVLQDIGPLGAQKVLTSFGRFRHSDWW